MGDIKPREQILFEKFEKWENYNNETLLGIQDYFHPGSAKHRSITHKNDRNSFLLDFEIQQEYIKLRLNKYNRNVKRLQSKMQHARILRPIYNLSFWKNSKIQTDFTKIKIEESSNIVKRLQMKNEENRILLEKKCKANTERLLLSLIHI